MSIVRQVTAFFKQILNTISITVNGSGAVVRTPDQPEGYVPGTIVTLTATPAVGWTFDHWTLPDGTVKTENPTTVTA